LIIIMTMLIIALQPSTATKNLRAQTSYTSEAEQCKQEEQKWQGWKMKHYEHEAIRMANQGKETEKNVIVFFSSTNDRKTLTLQFTLFSSWKQRRLYQMDAFS
jgi:hypothetical protein